MRSRGRTISAYNSLAAWRDYLGRVQKGAKVAKRGNGLSYLYVLCVLLLKACFPEINIGLVLGVAQKAYGLSCHGAHLLVASSRNRIFGDIILGPCGDSV